MQPNIFEPRVKALLHPRSKRKDLTAERCPQSQNFQSGLSIKLLMKGSDGLRGILGVNLSYPFRAPVNQHLKSDDATLEPRN